MQVHNLPTAFEERDADTLDLQHYWRIVRQSWMGILGLALVVTMGFFALAEIRSRIASRRRREAMA